MPKEDKEKTKKKSVKSSTPKEKPSGKSGKGDDQKVKSEKKIEKKETGVKKTVKENKGSVGASDKSQVITKSADNSVFKIITDVEDEIPFLLEKIQDSPSNRIVISIPAGSDLLVSTVSMNLIVRAADALKKNILLVTDDKTGQRMASLAGLVAKPSMNSVEDGDWEQSSKLAEDRKKKGLEEKIDVESVKTGEDLGPEKIENTEKPEDVVSMKEKITSPEESQGVPGQEVDDVETEESSTDEKLDFEDSVEDTAGGQDTPSETKVEAQKQTSVREVSDGDFQMTVDSSTMSGGSKVSGSIGGAVGAGMSAGEVSAASGPEVSSMSPGVEPPLAKQSLDSSSLAGSVSKEKPVGKIKSVPSEPVEKTRSLVGRDFASYEAVGAKKVSSFDDLPPKRDTGVPDSGRMPPEQKSGGVMSGAGDGLKKGLGVAGSFISGLIQKIKVFLKGKNATKILIPVLVIVVVLMAFLIWYLPEVIAEVKVESISVEYEGEIIALTSVDERDKEELKIPAKREEVLKNGSDNGTATGTAARGEKASGTVTLFNTTDEEVVVPSGTVLSNGGLNFILQGAVTLAKPDFAPMTQADGTVVAAEVGEEYNLEANTTLQVGSYDLGQVSAKNLNPLTGGSKTEYKVVSQDDIDKVADSLKKSLFDEAKGELEREGQESRWFFVPESVKNEVDGDVESDVPAGAEEETFNVSLKTKSSALYYDNNSLDALIEELLLDSIDEDSDLEDLEISENIEKTIEVKSVSMDEGKVVLSVSVSGFVMPRLDKSKIEKGLQGKGWAEGIKFLKQLDYVSGEPEVEFYPSWFPKIFWRMPSRDGRITVTVENIVPDEEDQQESEVEEDVQNSE
ncbi:baseplate J/gp47 family protein [Candidatus Dojkabacteria bacterium]|nr:baseplate J/gp47 family protein [Candidatus Dojkabacteria bacterium]